MFQLYRYVCGPCQVLHGVVTAPHLFNRQAGAAVGQLVRHGKALLACLGIACGHIGLGSRPGDGTAICRLCRQAANGALPAVAARCRHAAVQHIGTNLCGHAVYRCVQHKVQLRRAGVIGIAAIHPRLGQRNGFVAGIGIGKGDCCASCLLAGSIIRLPVTGNLFYRIGVLHPIGIHRQAGKGVLPAAVGGACQGDRAALVCIVLFQLQLNTVRAGDVFHSVVAAPHLFNCQAGVAVLQLVRYRKALLTDLGVPCGHYRFSCGVANSFALCRLGGQFFSRVAPACGGAGDTKRVILAPQLRTVYLSVQCKGHAGRAGIIAIVAVHPDFGKLLLFCAAVIGIGNRVAVLCGTVLAGVVRSPCALYLAHSILNCRAGRVVFCKAGKAVLPVARRTCRGGARRAKGCAVGQQL